MKHEASDTLARAPSGSRRAFRGGQRASLLPALWPGPCVARQAAEGIKAGCVCAPGQGVICAAHAIASVVARGSGCVRGEPPLRPYLLSSRSVAFPDGPSHAVTSRSAAPPIWPKICVNAATTTDRNSCASYSTSPLSIYLQHAMAKATRLTLPHRPPGALASNCRSATAGNGLLWRSIPVLLTS